MTDVSGKAGPFGFTDWAIVLAAAVQDESPSFEFVLVSSTL